MLQLSDTINSIKGSTETFLSPPSGKTQIVLDVEVVAFRYRPGDCVAITFAASDVVAAADTITKTAHGKSSGAGPYYISSDDTVPGGSAATTPYWLGKVDANTLVLCDSHDKAMRYEGLSTDGKTAARVNLSSQGVGNHTLGGVPAVAGASQTSGNGSLFLNAVGQHQVDAPRGITVKGSVSGSILNYWWV